MTQGLPAPAVAALQLALLGPPRLLRDGQAPVELNRLDAALLALLVLDHGIDRGRAGALLWPDADARRAGLSLRQRIFRLRRSAGVDVVVGSPRLVLAPGIVHDLLVLEGRSDGLDLPRGELLGTLDYAGTGELADWVATARERWRHARRDALAGTAARLEADGRLAPALRAAERLLEHEPHSEHAHRHVMRLHYLRGDRSAALQAFERCRSVLAQLLGEPPGDETVALAAAIGRSATPAVAAPAPTPPLTMLRPPRLVGREAAWQQLDEAAAQGRAVLVGGEPGIGKTRLLTDRLQAQGPGLLVDARPGDRRVPHALLLRLLHALADHQGPAPDAAVREELAWLQPALGPRPGGPVEPVRLQAALQRELVRAGAGGLRLLALDDLQCADDASLELLLPLTSSVSTPGWLLAARTAGRPPALLHWLDEAGPAGGVTEVPLQPLPPQAVHELLESLALPGLQPAAWADALQRHTGGHPMFVLETLRAALSATGRLPERPGTLPWPDRIGALLERRLQQLGAAARRLLQVAALADVDFSVPLAARVLQVHELDLAGSWRELEQAGLFGSAGPAHDLVRETAQRSVPAPIAQALHAQIAGHIGAAGAPAARVAEHWRRGGRWAAAARAWRQAAAAAQAAGRRREEAELLQAAVEDFLRAAADEGNTDAPALAAAAFDAACERIGALVQCASGDDLRAAIDALQAWPADESQQARRALAAAEAQIVFGEFEAVAAAMPAAIMRLADDVEAALLGTRRLAVALLNLGRATEAARALDACLPRLDELASDRARYEFLGELGTVLERCNRRREGFQHLQRGISLALQAHDLGTAATMYANLGVNRVYWGDAQAAIAATEQAMALRQQHDGISGLASGIDMTLGAMCRDAGRLGEGITRLERSLAAFEADGNRLWAANTAAHLGLLWVHLGQRARAARVLQAELDGLPAFIAARLLAARALLDELQGRSALPGLDAALARLDGADRVDVRLGIQLERMRLLDPAAGGALATTVGDEARRNELMGHAFGAEVLAADALRRGGRLQQAAQRAAELAADMAPLVPSGFYRPALWLALLRALHADGGGDGRAAAARLRARAQAELRQARTTLPEPFHDSFDRGQPVNLALLSAG